MKIILWFKDPDTAIALELGGVVVQHTKYNIINERPGTLIA